MPLRRRFPWQKIVAIIVIIAGALFLLNVNHASAQGWTGWQNYIPGDLRTGTLEGYIQAIINVALLLAGVVATLYLIIGGYRYITSSGNPEETAGAKNTILNAIIGLVIIFASYVIIDFVMQRIVAGRGGTTTTPTIPTTPTTPRTTPTTPATPTIPPSVPTTPSGG